MEKNLFGEKIKKRRSRLEKILEKYDKRSFDERLARLKYLENIFPRDYSIAGSPETVFIFDEIKMAFINGEFISTVMLAQAFIERILQEHLLVRGFVKESNRGMKAMIGFLRKNNMMDNFLLEKIDLLRKIRNPFSHLKDFSYKYNLNQRILNRVRNAPDTLIDFGQLLEDDAKNAICLMYTIFQKSKIILSSPPEDGPKLAKEKT